MINNWSPAAIERFAEREKIEAHRRRKCNNKIAYLSSNAVYLAASQMNTSFEPWDKLLGIKTKMVEPIFCGDGCMRWHITEMS